MRVIIQNKTSERALYTKIYGQDSRSSFGLIYQTRKDAKLNAKAIPKVRYHRRAQMHPQGRPPSLIVKRGSNRRKPGRQPRKDN